ncbi:MAG: hypothetical protein Q9202_007346 [Teloschistes flavicans]
MPSLQPPPGLKVDSDAPDTLAPTIYAATPIFIALAFLFVSLRAYTKIMIVGKASWDDRKIPLHDHDVRARLGKSAQDVFEDCLQTEPTSSSQISGLLYWIVFLLLAKYAGFGEHQWNVPLKLTSSHANRKLSYLLVCSGTLSKVLIDSTFFILYWSIFKPSRWLRFGIIGGAIVILTVLAALGLAVIILETPTLQGQRLDKSSVDVNRKLAIAWAVWGLVSDLYILVLPISGVMSLRLSPRKKIAVSLVFGSGFAVCICSSLQLYYNTLITQDVTYTEAKVETLCGVEICVGICITCVPATSMLIRHMTPGFGSIPSRAKSYFGKIWDRLRSNRDGVSQGTWYRESQTSQADGPYKNLKECKVVHDLDRYPIQGVRTIVSADPHGDSTDHNIHVRVDIRQE